MRDHARRPSKLSRGSRAHDDLRSYATDTCATGDVLIAVALIFLTLPLIGFVSLTINLNSHPVFLWHPRLGPDGPRSSALKFRTTEHDPAWALWDCEARVGRCLSHTRIDELPGIFNVLLGDIPLLGGERAETRDLQNLAKWAAWAATAAVAFEAVG
jgi:lipopolysaccharide/colanic/teichoic acid biosynthesis glycosyltransferase